MNALRREHIIMPQGNCPQDTISKIAWAFETTFYLSAWDGTFLVVRIEGSEFNYLARRQFQLPVISAQYVPYVNQFVVQLLSKEVIVVNCETGEDKPLFKADDLFSQIQYLP